MLFGAVAEMSFPSIFKTYLDNSSVHGFQHIADQNKSLAERGFWAVICSLAGYATWVLLKAALYSYKNNAVSFIVDPDYLRFNTTFPSLSVCETNSNFEGITSAGEREHSTDFKNVHENRWQHYGLVSWCQFDTKRIFGIYGPDRNLNIELFIREIAYYDGTCATCSSLCQDSLNCSGDMSYITKMTRSPCSHLISDCFWNEQPFDCCSHFLPLQTEFGVCFTINSANTVRNRTVPKLIFSLNKDTGPGKLMFSTNEKLNLYLHSMDDVPTINHPKLEKTLVSKNRPSSEFHWLFKMLEIHNDPILKTLPLEQRKCRFPEEKILRSYNIYSHSGCLVDCRARLQERLCNCTHHLMPKISGVKTCELDGIRCVSKHSISDKLRNPTCNCTESCVEADFNIISTRTITNRLDTGNEGSEPNNCKIIVKMDELPNVRVMRIVVRTKLDLVVSMGSTIGLFLGASLLSSVEILYFFFIRKRKQNRIITNKLNSKRPARVIKHY